MEELVVNACASGAVGMEFKSGLGQIIYRFAKRLRHRFTIFASSCVVLHFVAEMGGDKLTRYTFGHNKTSYCKVWFGFA